MKTLKRICLFYLNSGWLPPLLLAIFLMILSFGMLRTFFRMPNPAPFEELSKEIGFWIGITFIPTGIFGLGLLVNWIWLLFHKNWRNLVTSVLFIPFCYVLFFMFMCAYGILKQ